jgi:hypothetical protein
MSDTEAADGIIENSDDLDAFTADFFGRKEAEPTETTVEVEQDDEDDEAEVSEDQTATEEKAELEAEYKEQPPKKKTVQDRIDELVKQREDAKREAAAEVAKLRQELEDIKKVNVPKVEVPVSKEPDPLDTKEDGTLKYELGEFDPQYIRDLTRHTLAEETNRVKAEEANAARIRESQDAYATLQGSWNEKLETSKAEYPDIEEKGQALLANFNNLPQEYGSYLSSVLMSMDKGPDVLYYLSNNPEEAIKIVNSGAQKATLALGRIEAKFLEADAQKTLAKPKLSKAPPPIPANTRTRGTNGAFISVAPDTDDLKSFEKEFFRKN